MPKIAFIDNLRVFIIMMVLSHHAGNPYGGDDFWYFQRPEGQPASGLTALFMMLNPSYTMSVLLVFSGYLLPTSYDRRGFRQYSLEKFIRLGIPLIFGGMVMLPLMQYYSFHQHFGYTGYASFWQYYVEAWHGLGTKPQGWNGPGWPDRNLAHLWYIEHLLCYALAYGLWRRFASPAGSAPTVASPPPGHKAIFLYALSLSLATFVVRIWFPYNTVYPLLKVLQIDMSHFPLWLPAFFVGLAAYRGGWMQSFPWPRAKAWLCLAAALVVWNFITAMTPLSAWCFAPEAFAGATLNSLYRCAWECFFCTGATVGLIGLFRERLNFSGSLTRTLAANAYPVHVFHPPIVVGLQFALAEAPWPSFVKFVAVSILGIIACFGVSQLLIPRIPGARRVF